MTPPGQDVDVDEPDDDTDDDNAGTVTNQDKTGSESERPSPPRDGRTDAGRETRTDDYDPTASPDTLEQGSATCEGDTPLGGHAQRLSDR